jgi:excisionase family DNA binding protein
METSSEPEYLTIAEACARLGISRAQLQRLLRRFRLDYLLQAPQGREVRLRWSDIEGLVDRPQGGSQRTA